jgi:hypothetical protein
MVRSAGRSREPAAQSGLVWELSRGGHAAKTWPVATVDIGTGRIVSAGAGDGGVDRRR